MGREDPQMKLRLSEELKARIAAAAETSGRSMNAEIVQRLEATLDLDQGIPSGGYQTALAEYKQAVSEIRELKARLVRNIGREDQSYFHEVVMDAMRRVMKEEKMRQNGPSLQDDEKVETNEE